EVAGRDGPRVGHCRRASRRDGGDIYNRVLRESRMTGHAEFFRFALWGQADAMPAAGARLNRQP
ncbi:MAG TPA: hypothetical protein VND45_11300, partial [Thermoanaerobaculia bacterium]|nr:hypothetical protein [Thermoanaerobaculia bacterium]